MAAERILVVDDEPGVRSALEAILVDEGFVVTCVETGEDGISELQQGGYDAVMLDVWLPGMDGLATLQMLRERQFDVEVVMISGHGTIETAVNATKLGAFDFVEKPLSLEKTLLVLRNALRQRRLERVNLHLLEQLSHDTQILGRSSAAARLRKEVEVAAAAEAPVLVCGEQGTGRESLARRIHSAGGRPDAPFVDVPCAALDATAAAAALYGEGNVPGRIELAAGGSLFLEDVDRLPAELQRRLAATLSARSGDTVPARVLASTAPDPLLLHPDLRACLDVIRIVVPALRERRTDIPLLAERFMRDLSREYGRSAKQLAPDSLALLKRHDWPGNVRELRNVVERLLLFSEEDVIHVREMPEELGGRGAPVEDLYRDFGSLAEGLRAFERVHVQRVMTEQEGQVAAAAKKLGLSEHALKEILGRIGAK